MSTPATPSVPGIAVSGVMPLKTLDDWRAFIHQITPVIVTTLVGVHLVTNDQATLWVPIIFGIVDSALSLKNSTDKTRSYLYAGLGVVQAGTMVAGLFPQVASFVPAIGAAANILSSTLARHYTPTTSVIPSTNPPVEDVA